MLVVLVSLRYQKCMVLTQRRSLSYFSPFLLNSAIDGEGCSIDENAKGYLWRGDSRRAICYGATQPDGHSTGLGRITRGKTSLHGVGLHIGATGTMDTTISLHIILMKTFRIILSEKHGTFCRKEEASSG